MTWRRTMALWVGAIVLIDLAAALPGSRPNLPIWWGLLISIAAIGAITLYVVLRRTWYMEVAAAVTLVLVGVIGPRPGASSIAAALALALAATAYFTFKIEARVHDEQQATQEGKARTHEAVAFASRRILLVALLAALVAALWFHIPSLTAPFVSPRWAASLDAASTPILVALASVLLLVATGWTLIRLGRKGPLTAPEGTESSHGPNE